MFVFLAMLLGAVIGWLASLVTKTDTNEGVWLDITAGLLGAIPMASLLGNNSAFDSLLAGGLGAILAVGALQLVRTRLNRT